MKLPPKVCCAEQVGPGSSVVFRRDPSRCHVRTLGRSLVRVRPACLDGVLLRWLMETFSNTVCFFSHCISPHTPSKTRLDPTILLGHRPSTFPLGLNSAPALCSTRQVHDGGCVAYVANPRRSRSPDSLDVWILPPVWQYVGCL